MRARRRGRDGFPKPLNTHDRNRDRSGYCALPYQAGKSHNRVSINSFLFFGFHGIAPSSPTWKPSASSRPACRKYPPNDYSLTPKQYVRARRAHGRWFRHAIWQGSKLETILPDCFAHYYTASQNISPYYSFFRLAIHSFIHHVTQTAIFLSSHLNKDNEEAGPNLPYWPRLRPSLS